MSLSLYFVCQFSYLYLYLSVTVSTYNTYSYILAFIHQSKQLCHMAFFLILHFQLKLFSITTTNDGSILPNDRFLSHLKSWIHPLLFSLTPLLLHHQYLSILNIYSESNQLSSPPSYLLGPASSSFTWIIVTVSELISVLLQWSPSSTGWVD